MGDLKERVVRLENSSRLPEPMDDSERNKGGRMLSQDDFIALRGEGYEHLGVLYAEGYHVCHATFGKPRMDECLFCLSMLDKE